ncbi:MAG: sulfur carrier protein ThiS [Nitrospira sp.]|nr:sulfur carrier protein ThiS [Nitrospira sp.]
MKIVLNGAAREVAETATVSSLLEELGIKPERVAIEINLQIIDRLDFKTTSFKAGDKVEIIGFVGGGLNTQ